ncbi:hypothetical protein PanWU01x14_205710 [Parasponia andersonii]|uniref:Uncharacterized protein n=1 Tax=Parasponia andersonii TaxID=3476 RepID=A0A2P5BVT5_PARAD|nr:hypothetical protein PanWU01x14_205710 [Parasponia andersonii]
MERHPLLGERVKEVVAWASREQCHENKWSLLMAIVVVVAMATMDEVADELRARNKRVPMFGDDVGLGCGLKIRESKEYFQEQIIIGIVHELGISFGT